MAGQLELGLPEGSTSSPSRREQAARNILRIVRSQGHPYVELRQDGKRFIYFCILCLTPCFSWPILFDHLKGKLHARRLPTAKTTLLGPNPWPFNDGFIFFDTSTESDDEFPSSKKCVVSGASQSDIQLGSTDDTSDCPLVIPRMLIGNEIFEVKVRKVGMGKIAARFFEKETALNGIRRIWCEWLGKENNGQKDGVGVAEHDFAVIIFFYDYDWGRSFLALEDVMKSFLPTAPVGARGLKRMKSLSDPEDISDYLSNQYDTSLKEFSASSRATSRFPPARAVRKELRRRQRVVAETPCSFCAQKLLPRKDAATLLNLKTGKLACSSRNGNGAFHAFHVSCLIYWILLCEFEMATNGLVRRGTKRKIGTESETKAAGAQISTVSCPDCQGTGRIIDGDGMEHAPIRFSEMFKFQLKVCDARNEWITSPEVLQNCSIGLHFPAVNEEEKVEPIKLLHFYRAYEQSAAQEQSKSSS